jgi:hypothetical protein
MGGAVVLPATWAAVPAFARTAASADQGAGKQLKLRDCRSGDSGRIPYQP